MAARGVARVPADVAAGFRRVAGTCNVTARGTVAGRREVVAKWSGGGGWRPFRGLWLLCKCRLDLSPAGLQGHVHPLPATALRGAGETEPESSPGSAYADLLLLPRILKFGVEGETWDVGPADELKKT